jgi:hypothetical protein
MNITGTRTHQDYYGQYGTFEMVVTRLYKKVEWNIPSFTPTYFKESACTVYKVVVGKSMNKTAVLAQMNQIVFSPIECNKYFEKRNLPAIAKQPTTWQNTIWNGVRHARLKMHWSSGNSFSQPHIIFMHDTPSKKLI